jgi:hypothetical protein
MVRVVRFCTDAVNRPSGSAYFVSPSPSTRGIATAS